MHYSEEHLHEISTYVYKYALIMLKNVEDSKDISQEVLYKYINSNIDFIDSFKEKAWIYKVTRNLCFNLLKSSWYKKRVSLSEEIINHTPILESNQDMEEIITLINELRKLSPKYKEVLVLYYFEQYSVKEISIILELNENTVLSRLSRGRKNLRERMQNV